MASFSVVMTCKQVSGVESHYTVGFFSFIIHVAGLSFFLSNNSYYS